MKKFSNLFVFLLILIAFLGTSVLVGCTNPFMPDLPEDDPVIEDPSGSETPENPGDEDPSDKPGTNHDQPGTNPDDPGTNPDDPGTNPDDPGTNPDDPGTNPDEPGTNPDEPGTNPDEPKEEEPSTGNGGIDIDFN